MKWTYTLRQIIAAPCKPAGAKNALRAPWPFNDQRVAMNVEQIDRVQLSKIDC